MGSAATYMASAFKTFSIINYLVVNDGTNTGLKSIDGNLLPRDGTSYHYTHDTVQSTGNEFAYRVYILFVYLRQLQLLKD